MAEFQKVMADAKRMCDYYSKRKGCEGCAKCPAHDIGCALDFDDPEQIKAFEEGATNWAITHPEVYPTWNKWIQSLGVTNLDGMIAPELAKRFGIETVTIEYLNKAILCRYHECGRCSGTKEMEPCQGVCCGMFELGLG